MSSAAAVTASGQQPGAPLFFGGSVTTPPAGGYQANPAMTAAYGGGGIFGAVPNPYMQGPSQMNPYMQGPYGWGGVGGYAPMSNVIGGQWEPTQQGGSTFNLGSTPNWSPGAGSAQPMMMAPDGANGGMINRPQAYGVNPGANQGTPYDPGWLRTPMIR